MLSLARVGIILTACWSAVGCQSSLPDAQLVVEEDVGFWVIGNVTNEITALTGFNRVPGVTENSELALEVKPGTFARLYTSGEGECIANIIWCEDNQITFTFWMKVLEWRDSGTQYIARVGSIISETAFVVITNGDNPLRVFFNGGDKDYEYFIDRELVQEWTFFAAVIDVNITSMKVYLNGTQLPDSDLEVSDNIENSRARFITLGSSSQVPDYYFGSFQIFYKALSQMELEIMYAAAVNGSGSNSTDRQNQETTETLTTGTIATNTMPVDASRITTTLMNSNTTTSSATATTPTTRNTTASQGTRTTTVTTTGATTKSTIMNTEATMPNTVRAVTITPSETTNSSMTTATITAASEANTMTSTSTKTAPIPTTTTPTAATTPYMTETTLTMSATTTTTTPSTDTTDTETTPTPASTISATTTTTTRTTAQEQEESGNSATSTMFTNRITVTILAVLGLIASGAL